MDRGRHKKISDLFTKACRLNPEEREEFLREKCGDDPGLSEEVRSLLIHDAQSSDSLDSGDRLIPLPGEADRLEALPGHVGNYRILERVGEGGMGVVYLAQQERPISRNVALKLIKLGMDSRAVLARFEVERQALALMNHPNIARVFDAGTTEEGRPYFAMEHVKGVPITEHCDGQRLMTHERLALFLQVCEGVQHAHQKGIIHRDLKPSNVLVSMEEGGATPKIIDFGVAKAIEQRLTERTLFTELGQLVGTPEYMSPEQAELTQGDIDTRTDVYSLGVLLYELLAGALPFDPRELRGAGFDEIRRKISEEEPSKPSTRFGGLGAASTQSAERRRTDPASLVRQLRGDLDWITMKALEKDRTRRYGSPSELADDIRRHLRHKPVLASPPSVAYLAGKFVRRHRLGVGVGALLAAVLVAFTVMTTVQSRRISREARTSERVSEFLADMLGSVDPEVLGRSLVRDLRVRIEAAQRDGGGTEEDVERVLAGFTEAMRDVNATDVGLRMLDEQILARAVQTIQEQLSEEPRIAGRLEHTIGWTYKQLGLYRQAEPHALRAVEIRSRVLGGDHPDTLNSMSNLANVYWHQGRYYEVESLDLEVLETRKRVLGADHPSTLMSMNNLAVVYDDQGRYDEAEPLYLETLETRTRLLGSEHPDTLGTLNNLATLYLNQGRYDEAEPLYLDALEIRKRVVGSDDPDTLASISNLAELYWTQGRYGEAEPLCLEALDLRKRVLGDNHPDTLLSLNNLATLYQSQGRYEAARPFVVEYLSLQKKRAESSADVVASNSYARIALTCEPVDLRDPRMALRFAVAANEKTGYRHPTYLETLALAYQLTGDTAKAIEIQKLAIAQIPDSNSPLRQSMEETLAELETVSSGGG